MKILEIKAEMRAAGGSATARRLRQSGKVPGVLYGHGEEVLPLALNIDEITGFLNSGSQVVTLKMGDATQRALLKEVQHDVWGKDILHVDFSRVGMDETVTVEVPVKSHGVPKSLAGGAVLEQPLHTLEVECRVDAIPAEIRVEVAEMELDDKIQVSDLKLPEGVKALNDADAIVFVVKAAREEIIAPAAAPVEGAAAEPELIRPVKEAAEGEGEEEKEAKS